MLIFSVSVCLSSQTFFTTLRDSSDSLTQGCISGSDIDVCMLVPATDSMVEMYQSVGRLSDGNEMQIGQQSFQHLQQNRASLEYSCFLILLLDLYESWNCPTNEEICDTERSERRIKQHPHTKSSESARNSRKKNLYTVIIVAAYTFLNLRGLDTTSHGSISPSASSSREAAWLAAEAYSQLFKNKKTLSVAFKQDWLKYWTPTNELNCCHSEVRGIQCDPTTIITNLYSSSELSFSIFQLFVWVFRPFGSVLLLSV